MNKTRLIAAMVSAIALFATNQRTVAQTIAPAFANDYSLDDLGSAPGVPASYGGLTLLNGNQNVLLLGGAANGGSGAVYAIPVVRDSAGHIIGFSGSATVFSTAPNIDGGLAYGPDGVLFYTGYSNNILGQIKPGSTSPDKIIDLSALGVSGSVGTVQFVPAGFPDAGAIRLASYSGGGFYSGTLTADGMGTFNLSNVMLRASPGGGPEGIVYVPPGAPVFNGPSMLISEYSAARVSAYQLDANGIPITSTRQDFITGLSGAEGAFIDPVTKDFLFSTFGGGNRVIAVRGFVVPPCTPAPAGMVSWYPLDATGADIQDGNSGTPQGNVTFVNGRVDRAARLGGTGNTSGVGDRIVVGNAANLQLQDFTMDAWIKRASSTIVTNNGRAGVEGGTFFAWGNGGYGFLIDQATGRIGLTKVEESAAFSTTTITDTNYHHVAVTKSGGTVTFYIDGVADAPVSYNPTFTFATAAAIGARGDNDVQNAFFGDIDELEIFSRALGATEVQAIFNAGTSGKCRTCTPPPANMVLWLPGDGNADDLSSSNNDGTAMNGTTFLPGYVAQAFSFDGVDDQVTVPHNTNQNVGSQVTIDAWIYPLANKHGQTILQKRNASNTGGYVFETTAQPAGGDNGLQWVIMINGSYRVLQTPANVLTLNTWQHVAATYDGATMRIFVNGAERASKAESGAIDATTDPMVIGRNVANVSIAYQGLIDEVELFGRALSQAEIQAIVNAGNAGKCKPVPCPTITLSPTTLPAGTVGTAYTQTVTASGGSGTYTYSVSSGALPPGLTLNASTGAISGTPTTTNASPYSFTITATDASTTCTGSRDYTVTINCPVTTL
ncbi:MAG TPA: LamG-like jellyroll fold domain-containing protein, partial [Chthoniobacterales bacterium]